MIAELDAARQARPTTPTRDPETATAGTASLASPLEAITVGRKYLHPQLTRTRYRRPVAPRRPGRWKRPSTGASETPTRRRRRSRPPMPRNKACGPLPTGNRRPRPRQHRCPTHGGMSPLSATSSSTRPVRAFTRPVPYGGEEFPNFDATCEGTISDRSAACKTHSANWSRSTRSTSASGLYQHDVNPKHLRESLDASSSDASTP